MKNRKWDEAAYGPLTMESLAMSLEHPERYALRENWHPAGEVIPGSCMPLAFYVVSGRIRLMAPEVLELGPGDIYDMPGGDYKYEILGDERLHYMLAFPLPPAMWPWKIERPTGVKRLTVERWDETTNGPLTRTSLRAQLDHPPRYALIERRYDPGHKSTSWDMYAMTTYVVAGRARFTVGDVVEVGPGDIVHQPAGDHGLEVLGDEPYVEIDVIPLPPEAWGLDE